eukprot:scaffold157380_cov18-Tisochrysis_lutea.AAC.6
MATSCAILSGATVNSAYMQRSLSQDVQCPVATSCAILSGATVNSAYMQHSFIERRAVPNGNTPVPSCPCITVSSVYLQHSGNTVLMCLALPTIHVV